MSRDTVLTVDNARNYSSLIPFIENDYIISGLYPADSVAVIVTAVSYVGQKTVGVEVANGQTFGTGNETVWRTCTCTYNSVVYVQKFLLKLLIVLIKIFEALTAFF